MEGSPVITGCTMIDGVCEIDTPLHLYGGSMTAQEPPRRHHYRGSRAPAQDLRPSGGEAR